MKNARLDVSLWDSDVSMTEEAGFLGEVLLNVGKLINYAGTGIQQTFTVRTAPDKDGNTEQNGQFVMILLYDHDRKSGSSQDPVVGCTIKMPQPWSDAPAGWSRDSYLCADGSAGGMRGPRACPTDAGCEAWGLCSVSSQQEGEDDWELIVRV